MVKDKKERAGLVHAGASLQPSAVILIANPSVRLVVFFSQRRGNSFRRGEFRLVHLGATIWGPWTRWTM